MKHTLFSRHAFFSMAIFMTAATSQMALADNMIFSSDTCADIDKKIIKLDQFTTMVNNTSAFHLEERASALPVPGITVSTNKKKMLRDVKKKYAEYTAARQKYGCVTPVKTHTQAVHQKAMGSRPAISTDRSVDKVALADNMIFSSDTCADIDKKIIKLDQFTTMVNNTSAFHLEERASALPVPGITVSTNKKKMLRDVKKKYAEYTAARQKYGCVTPVKTHTQAVYKKAVVSRPAKVDKKVIKTDTGVHKVDNIRTASAKVAVKPQKEVVKTPVVTQTAVQKRINHTQVSSVDRSDTCAEISKKIMKLDQFTTMVNNTSAFHLEEKAAAMPVPGITVSTNKKKMLRSAKKKMVKLFKAYQKNGCESYK